MACPKKMRLGIFNRLVNGGEGMGGVGFTPLSLFKNNEQGAWYDPSDISTLFQDAEGTTPVTADGDPVGLMLDKSGNGNHATQSVSAKRPVYKTDGMLHWLDLDGSSNLTHPYSSGTSNLTLAASGEAYSSASRQQLISAGAAGDKLTSLIWINTNSGTSWGTYTSGDIPTGDSALNTPLVMINVGNYTSRVQKLYTNGQSAATFNGIYRGDDKDRRFMGSEKVDDNFMEGRIYGVVALGRETTSTELSNVNKYLADLAGVEL